MFEYVRVPEPKDANIGALTKAFEVAMAAPRPGAAVVTLLKSLGQTFHAQRAYVYQLPPHGTEFECTFEWCAEGIESMVDVPHGLTMGMAARWFGDGQPRSILAIRDTKEVAQVNPDYAALFAVRDMRTQILGKLMRASRPMGVLGFDDPDPEQFDTLCDLMYPICSFATSTVNTHNLLGRMNSAGMVDKLTGAGTRISFYQHAELLPTDVPVGMAYLDVVGLQGVNDVRGHSAGDELLIAVRQALVAEFADDQVFRMSGDEFLVVGIGLPEAVFRSAMDRIRKRLDEFSAYVAMGVDWQHRLGSDYDAIVKHAWLSCANDKQEWERRGGTRLGERAEDLRPAPAAARRASSIDNKLDIPCYHNDEFFHRANIWARHMDVARVGIVAFDINYFKLYNDIYGRDAGDLLLETYGKLFVRLASKVRGVAGYLGGDNFVLAFPAPDPFDRAAFAQQAEDQLKAHANAEGFSPSIGIAVSDDRAMGMSILYDRALIALQEVKGSYTNHVAFYDEQRYERERENQLLLIRAKEGLANHEFTFYLQPKVNIVSNKVISAEALVRWIHDGEVVSPYKFVGPMERSGYIFALDRYIWESVCAWQRSLIDRGIEPVPVSVNVSRVDFHFVDLAEHFQTLIERYDLPPRMVGIEVTESAYSEDSIHITNVMRRMQQAGFLVFMDDFGSGYSSLNMLRSVAVDVLKMDKGFIDHADMHNGSDAIIENVIRMAHKMGLPVISEGVETEEQRNSLRTMDCDYVQGYYYYRPMPIEQFEEILRRGEAVEHNYTGRPVMPLSEN